MNEEAKELSQNTAPEAATQQQAPEVAQPTETKTENATATPTPDRSITETKRSFWDKLFNKKTATAGVAAGAAVAASIAMAPSTSAETQEKPTTSISQQNEALTQNEDDKKVTETSLGDITEENGHVVEVDRYSDENEHDPGYKLAKVDDDTVAVTGREVNVHDSSEVIRTAKENAQGGLDELTGIGMDIKNVESKKISGNEDGHALEVDVDDANKLDRSKDQLEEINKEDGHVVEVDRYSDENEYDPGYKLAKVDDDTVAVTGREVNVHDSSEVIRTAKENAQGGLDELTDIGMDVKNIEAQKMPGNEDGHALKVNVDDANKLDKLAKEEK